MGNNASASAGAAGADGQDPTAGRSDGQERARSFSGGMESSSRGVREMSPPENPRRIRSPFLIPSQVN